LLLKFLGSKCDFFSIKGLKCKKFGFNDFGMHASRSELVTIACPLVRCHTKTLLLSSDWMQGNVTQQVCSLNVIADADGHDQRRRDKAGAVQERWLWRRLFVEGHGIMAWEEEEEDATIN
jgi:hypothetical protein